MSLESIHMLVWRIGNIFKFLKVTYYNSQFFPRNLLFIYVYQNILKLVSEYPGITACTAIDISQEQMLCPAAQDWLGCEHPMSECSAEPRLLHLHSRVLLMHPGGTRQRQSACEPLTSQARPGWSLTYGYCLAQCQVLWKFQEWISQQKISLPAPPPSLCFKWK